LRGFSVRDGASVARPSQNVEVGPCRRPGSAGRRPSIPVPRSELPSGNDAELVEHSLDLVIRLDAELKERDLAFRVDSSSIRVVRPELRPDEGLRVLPKLFVRPVERRGLLHVGSGYSNVVLSFSRERP